MSPVKTPRKDETAPLTAREAAFVREYLLDGNATQAAIRAGYSAKTAASQASRLLKRVNVQQAVDRVKAKTAERLEEKFEITLDRVVAELAKIAFVNHEDFITIGADGDPFLDLSKLTRDQAAAIQEMTVEDYLDGRGKNARQVRKVRVKLFDKKSALVDLGKHLGGFRNNVDLGVQKGNPLAELMTQITRSALSVRPSTPEEPA